MRTTLASALTLVALALSVSVAEAERWQAVVVPRPKGTQTRYLVDRKIGSGTLADVYEGHEATSGQKVALKILNDGFKDAQIGGRPVLEHEHRVLTALGQAQAGLPASYGVGATIDATQRRALVMELVAGEPLGPHWNRVSHRHPVSQAARILIKLATDVDRMNLAGWAHYDIHPGNVRIDHDQSATARLVDVGHAGGFQLGGQNPDLESDGYLGLARIGLALVTGMRSDDPQALAAIPSVSARAADGSTVTFEAVLRAALAGKYTRASAFAAALTPFGAL